MAGAGDEEAIVRSQIDPQKVQQDVQQARAAFPALAGRKDFLRMIPVD